MLDLVDFNYFNKLLNRTLTKYKINKTGPFSTMVQNEVYRRNFVTTSVKFLRDNGFDGLDR